MWIVVAQVESLLRRCADGFIIHGIDTEMSLQMAGFGID